MTHLCYTLEEAADKLKLTETVLVRLSQYFKVPKAAYEESGYLSFKGDLAFMDQDIEFFRQVKERLLSGETLENIKSRMREESPASIREATTAAESNLEWREALSAKMRSHSPTPEAAGQLGMAPNQPVWHAAPEATEASVPVVQRDVQGMRELQDRKPYEKAAEESFERYKSIHRTGLGKVFENMLKEVGSTQSGRKQSGGTGYRPMRNKLEPEASRNSAGAPFDSMGSSRTTNQIPPARSRAASGGGDASWDQLIRQATSQPRTMNSHLKSAAALLKERALGSTSQKRPYST